MGGCVGEWVHIAAFLCGPLGFPPFRTTLPRPGDGFARPCWHPPRMWPLAPRAAGACGAHFWRNSRRAEGLPASPQGESGAPAHLPHCSPARWEGAGPSAPPIHPIPLNPHPLLPSSSCTQAFPYFYIPYPEDFPTSPSDGACAAPSCWLLLPGSQPTKPHALLEPGRGAARPASPLKIWLVWWRVVAVHAVSLQSRLGRLSANLQSRSAWRGWARL